jgi:hypothetical protein
MDYEFLLLEFQRHRARTANWFSWDGNGLGLGPFDATKGAPTETGDASS